LIRGSHQFVEKHPEARDAPDAARMKDPGQSDFVKVDCAAVALLMPEFLLRLRLSPHAKVLDLKERVRCRGCGARGEPSFLRSSGGARSRVTPRLLLPGDSIQPAWGTRLVALPADQCITIGGVDHMFAMEYRATHQALARLL
jgi:hypothetical protein